MRFKVWGEWQEYDEGAEYDASSGDAAALQVARDCSDAFPDDNDGDTCKLYVRSVDAEDGDDEWCPEDDPETTSFTVTLNVRRNYTVKRAKF